MPQQLKGVLLSQVAHGEEYRELAVQVEGLTAAEPGQFAALKVGKTLDPLLRRPLSIYDQEPREGVLRFLYRLVGRGTRLLAETGEGEEVDLIAPLGRGFSLKGLHPGTPALLVAGGAGAAPLHFLARKLKERQIPVLFFLGGRGAADLAFRGELASLLKEGLHITTEDGSLGRRGLVTGALQGYLEGKKNRGDSRLFACGPEAMLREVARLAGDLGPFPLQVSLEARMACGFGACLGCACPGGGGEGRPVYRRVCSDGPVFFAGEVEL